MKKGGDAIKTVTKNHGDRRKKPCGFVFLIEDTNYNVVTLCCVDTDIQAEAE